MTYVAEFTIPPEEFPFGKTLKEMPDVEIEVDQIVPTGESALPFFWVRGCDPEAFMEYAESEPEVRDTRLLERVDGVALFRAEWRPNADLISGFERIDATIVESVGTAEHWRFEVRSAEPDQLEGFQETFEREGIPVDLVRLYGLGELIEGEHRHLSSKQREALLAAYRQGYFEKPRNVTQEDLADRFDVSRRAVSERLRRGTGNLVAATLLPAGQEDGSDAD